MPLSPLTRFPTASSRAGRRSAVWGIVFAGVLACRLPAPDVLAAGAPTSPCPNGLCPGLGNSFYLPGLNAFSAITGGKVIFRDRHLGTCAVHHPEVAQASRSFRYFTSTENFFSAASAETQISGSYSSKKLTFTGSFEATTGHSVAEKKSVRSLDLDITYLNGAIDFVQSSECVSLENLDDELVETFRSLPLILDPHIDASWAPYLSFLRAWGSHVMVQQTLGSRFQQWESVLETDSISQSELQIKACAEVEGTGKEEAGWSVAGCAAYTDEEKASALRKETKQSRLIVGGTETTRKELLKRVDEETLNAFIESADQSDQAVQHEWLSLWTVLERVFQKFCDRSDPKSCEDYQRALNLEAAYEGWLAVGCPRIEARGSFLQTMIAYPPIGAIKTYGCLARKEGCIADDDCHIGGALSVCYCYGAGCVERDLDQPVGDPDAPSDWRNTVRSEQLGSFNEGVNRSCYYRIGVTCGCDTAKQVGLGARFLWRQGVPSI